MIPLSVPFINGNEWKYVKKCLDTGWISSSGTFVNDFEKGIANFVGVKHAVACMNGTAGLQIAQIVCGVKKSDYVIVPNLTFVATLNSVRHVGASPILIDANINSWQMNLDLLEKFLFEETELVKCNDRFYSFKKSDGKRVYAIMPVHVLGALVDMNRLIKIAQKYHLIIIEDSTEALGSFKDGKHAGTFGLTGILSFNGNKIISTGGGGMILTNDKKIAIRAKHITTTAKTDPLDYFHDEVGYNYRLVNVLAAIGLAQIENFEIILKRKKEIDNLYRRELDGIGDIKFQINDPKSDPNCWLFTFRTKRMRELLDHLNNRKIQSRPFWTPMNNLPMYKNLIYINENDISNKIFKECISIPSSSNLTASDQHKVISEIKSFYK